MKPPHCCTNHAFTKMAGKNDSKEELAWLSERLAAIIEALRQVNITPESEQAKKFGTFLELFVSVVGKHSSDYTKALAKKVVLYEHCFTAGQAAIVAIAMKKNALFGAAVRDARRDCGRGP